jgi:hypothetical protein
MELLSMSQEVDIIIDRSGGMGVTPAQDIVLRSAVDRFYCFVDLHLTYRRRACTAQDIAHHVG